MIVTMLQAEVAEERSSQLEEAFNDGSRSLPVPIRESFLIHES